jgi:hypothetical protein
MIPRAIIDRRRHSMRWEKLGLVYVPDGSIDWMRSHAAIPTAIHLDANVIRIFLAFRDAANISRIGWIDVASGSDFKVLRISERPCLDIGRPGAFDDNGVLPIAVIRVGNSLRAYYTGWQLTPRVRYLLFTGVAISSDNGVTFGRYSDTPVFERSSDELIVRSGPSILEHDGKWKAWYSAGSETIRIGSAQVPTYHFAYMESDDGLTWPATGTTVMEPSRPDEFGLSRPFVELKDRTYHMWYSVRSQSRGYTIGYATSHEGQFWIRRDDEGGLLPSSDGWDSEMVGFPSLIDTAAGRFMFYNGNDYGATGVGVARLVD